MHRRQVIWTFAICSLALFMVVLDNLVVTTALPVIRHDLGATLQQLEWTVNAYTLTYAVLLLSGAAMGDRFGRKKLFIAGLALFTAASAGSALAPSAGALIAARAVQGVGGAIITPLSLTILSDAVGIKNRGMALGAWSAVAGVAVAAGPVIGGAVVDGISWHWIFWINVPVGIALLPAALFYLRESHGEKAPLDLPGLALVSVGLLGIVWALVNGNSDGWGSAKIVVPLAAGAALVLGFIGWEKVSKAPMVPLRLFRNRPFAAANGAALLMYFGSFGAVFLLVQFLQIAQGYSPLQAGLRCLPWTLAPMFIAPVVGAMSDKYGGGRFMVVGLVLQAIGMAWLALVITATVPFTTLFGGLLLSGIGNGFFYAPVANVVLGAVSPQDEGKASGVNNGLRELGGVFGIAVLASVFAHDGGFGSPHAYVNGLIPAVWLGTAAVAAAAVVAIAIGKGRTMTSHVAAAAERDAEPQFEPERERELALVAD
jgi:EmrB/QacA subfamily drug resistance transporter